jgi:hypothetical protein
VAMRRTVADATHTSHPIVSLSTAPLNNSPGPSSSTVPDWLLTLLGSALAAARRSSTYVRAPVAQSSATKVSLTTQLVFPPRGTPPTASLRLLLASQTQLSRLWVCAPHWRVLGVSLALIEEPRERSG